MESGFPFIHLLLRVLIKQDTTCSLVRYFRGAVILILSPLDGVSWVHLIWVFLKILEYSFNVIVIPPALSDFLESVMSLIQTYREQEWSLKHFCYINVCYSTHQKQCMKRKKSFCFFYLGECVSRGVLLIERTETLLLLYSGSPLVWDPVEQENKAWGVSYSP